MNGADPANGTNGDYGQSNVHITNTHLHGSGGTGVYLNGFGSRIDDSDISMFVGPNVQLGGWANFVQISNLYMERSSGSEPCILYGDASGPRASNLIDSGKLSNVYCNPHNLDKSTTVHFAAPASATTGLSNWAVRDVYVASTQDTSYELFVLNTAVASQTGNTIDRSRYFGPLLTAGTPVGITWAGSQGQGNLWWNKADADNYFNLRSGQTAIQYAGIKFLDNLGADMGRIYSGGTSHNIYLVAPGNVQILRGDSDGIVYLGSGATTTVDADGTLVVAGGAGIVYRCVTDGALPTGALTITAANCGSTADSGLRIK